MSAPALLLDNDALLKAAHWELLERLPHLAATTWPQSAGLPSFPPRVRRAEPKLFADPLVAQQLQPFLDQMTALPEPELNVLAALQGEVGIDVGEQLLVAALAASPTTRLLTGDKRALIALATIPAIATCHGRFLCVEQLLWLGLDHLGPALLTARVRRWPAHKEHTAMAIFGSAGEKTDAQLREGLHSYLHWLDGQAPGLLARGFGL